MPGGKRNPLSMSQMLETLGDVVQNAKTKADSHLHKVGQTDLPSGASFVDLNIQFIGASGLPKMDVVGTADPYFVAKIDKRISFVSTVIKNNLAPVWNEAWRVSNVPTTATLHITVMDKDEGAMTDDYIGAFETSVAAGAKEAEIVGPMFRRGRGTFWLKIDSTPTLDVNRASQFPYLFDGPVRYSRHFSPTVGLLTNVDEARLYSTWKMYIRGVPLFFGDVHQHWNRNYKAAQTIFQGPTSLAVRSGIQAGHRMLYARTAANGFGLIEKPTDVIELLHGGVGRPNSKNANIQMLHTKRVKPAVYTYIISSDDASFRFSETGAAFFVDFASKHALHSNCNETVRFSGEFHPRPSGGWQNFSDDIPDDKVEWELVIDNNSGTYAPDKKMLPALKGLLQNNFPGFTIYALDREDPSLKESVDACRDYAVKYRGVGKDELQPTANDGEVTLMHQVSMNSEKKSGRQYGTMGDEQEWNEKETRHARYGSNGSSTGRSENGGYSDDQGAPALYGQAAHSPRYGSPSSAGQQPPPLPPRPNLTTLPRTSSEYFKDSTLTVAEVGGQSSFPEPTQYVPPSAEGRFVPISNPNYGHTPPIQSHSPPPSEPEFRPPSGDYSRLPPGCAPAAKFTPEVTSYGSSYKQGTYGTENMSRYDPNRR